MEQKATLRALEQRRLLLLWLLLKHFLLLALGLDVSGFLRVIVDDVGVERPGTVELLRFNFLLCLHFNYCQHISLLLDLIRANLSLQLVEFGGVGHLDALRRRDDLIIKVIVIVEGDPVLDQEVGLRAVRLVDFHVRLGHHFELYRAFDLKIAHVLSSFRNVLLYGLIDTGRVLRWSANTATVSRKVIILRHIGHFNNN